MHPGSRGRMGLTCLNNPADWQGTKATGISRNDMWPLDEEAGLARGAHLWEQSRGDI